MDRLAIGGMAEVYLAVDPGLGEEVPVVIKRILPHLAQDGTFVRMFLQEARISLSVHHPHVVRVDKLGEDGGLPYLAMEYIHGLTFRELAREAAKRGGRLPVGVAVELVAQACDGAHALHETVVGQHREIVHRDLCPHNLMVDEQGIVKVLDFGIAKAAQGMDTTRTGVLKGKTSYLAPEQVRRGTVDRRTDVWTLSLVAWELLSGARAFEGKGDYDTMQAIAQADIPRLEQIRPDLPALLVEVVHRSLAVDPAARYGTAEELAQALRDAADLAGIAAHPREVREAVRDLMDLDPDKTQPDTPADKTVPGPPTDASGAIRSRGALSAHLGEPPVALPPPRRSGWWAAAIAGFVFIGLGLFAGGLVLGAMVLAPAPPEGPVLRLTLAPVMPPTEMVGELEPLRADLERDLRRPVRLQVASSYEDVGRLVVQEKTELAVLPPLLYLKTRAVLGDRLRLLAMTVHDEAPGVDGVLIARREFAWEGPESLRGKSICYTDQASTTGYALPRRWLRDHGIQPDTDLAAPVFSGNHHQVIVDVANRKCEFGATFSAALRSAYEVGVPVAETRQLDITGRTPNDTVVAAPSLDQETVDAVQRALLAWNAQSRHGSRYIGARLHLSAFVPVEDQDYADIRRALGEP